MSRFLYSILPIGVIVLALSTSVMAQAPADSTTQGTPACAAAPPASEAPPTTDQVQRQSPCRAGSIFSAAESPAVFSDVRIRGTDLLEASLSVEDKGGSLTYAPLLYTLRDYRPLASELRLRLSQKDNLTALGIGTQYNPLSPRSGRGKREWLKPGGAQPPLQQLQILLAKQKTIHETELTRLRGAFREASSVPANVADAEAKREQQRMIVEEIVRVQRDLAAVNAESASLVATDSKVAGKRLQEFYQRLLSARLPVVGFAYNATLFTTLEGSSVDADKDGLNDVEHRLKKQSLSISIDSRLSERVQLSGLVVREWDRGSAEAGTAFADVTGLSLSAGRIIAILDDKYADSDAYHANLFIPSVVLGGAIEWRGCGNSSAAGVICPNGLQRLTAVTPFVDLKVTPTVQFRIGAPVRFSKPVSGSSGTDLGFVTAFTLQLGQPK